MTSTPQKESKAELEATPAEKRKETDKACVTEGRRPDTRAQTAPQPPQAGERSVLSCGRQSRAEQSRVTLLRPACSAPDGRHLATLTPQIEKVQGLLGS